MKMRLDSNCGFAAAVASVLLSSLAAVHAADRVTRVEARAERLAAGSSIPARFDVVEGPALVRTILGRFEPSDPSVSREAAARTFLADEADLLGIAEVADDLIVARRTEDAGGVVVRFDQVHEGVPLFEGGAIVGFDPEGRIVIVRNDCETDFPAARPSIDALAAISAAGEALGAVLDGGASPRLVFVRGDKQHPGLHLAWEVARVLEAPRGDWHVFVSAATGEVVRILDAMKYSGAACVPCDPTVGTTCGRVFARNPVDQLNNTSLMDFSNVDAAQAGCQLSNLISATNLTGTYASTSATSGRISPPYSSFRSASQPSVDEVNAYYHADRAKGYLNTLGFASVMNFAIGLNAHAFGDDNSFYSPATKVLSFGLGGVDDAQDADVIYHEYGHAIQDDQVPGFGTSDQSAAAGEGFGDYWAAALTDEIAATNLGTGCFAPWNAVSLNPYDGTFGSGCMRRVDGPKQYPRDYAWEILGDGEMWSGALWRLRNAVGAAVADALVIKSHTFVTPSSRFRQLADAMLAADAALFGSTHTAAIHQAFKMQGLPRTGTAASSSGLTTTVPFVCETAHNYANFAYKECIFTQPGAARLRFHFSQFESEPGFDWAYLSDGDFNEVEALNGQPFGVGGGYSATVSGDTIVLRFKADDTTTAYGFRIDQVQYGVASDPPSGTVPDRLTQGTPLRVAKGVGGQVTLTWGASCSGTDTDYEVYEGTLGSFTTHQPVTCMNGGAQTRSFAPQAGNRYFLVAPRNATREGSYGKNKAGVERPPSANQCVPQLIAGSCP